MPSASNIIAKNAAGTNVTFEVVTASAGDSSPARYQLTAAAGIALGRPTFEIMARPNADRSARKVMTTLKVPYLVTDSVTGLQRVAANVDFRNNEMTAPKSVPDTVIADAVAYWSSLNASTQVTDSQKTGYAPV